MPDDQDPPESFDEAAIVTAVAAGEFEGFVRRAHLALEQPEWEAFERLVASLHRARKIDLLAAVTVRTEGKLPYVVENVLGTVFGDLDLTLEAILGAMPVLSARWRGEGAPYWLRNSFSAWCDQAPGRVDAALAAIRSGEAPAELLMPTLLSGMRVAQPRYIDILAAMLAGPSLEEANTAASVFGYAVAETPEARARIFAILRQALDAADAERIAELFRALLALSLAVPGDEAVALAAIASVKHRATPVVLTAAANSLAVHRATATRAAIETICALLAEVGPDEVETLDAIDHLLFVLLAGADADAALALLERLLAEGRATLDTLDTTAHQIMTNNSGLRERLIAAWLVNDAPGMVEAVHALAMLVANDPPTFDLDFAPHALSAEDAATAGRRAVAKLILFPETATSILVSLLRTGPPQAAPLIEEMLLDPLLLSYWETPRKYLETVAAKEGGEIAALIARALAALDAYVATIEEAGVIAELRPSERHRFIAAVQHAELQREIAKGASKGALASLFPVSVLLYGDSAVNDIFAADGSTSRSEFRLGTIEHSQEIARLDSVDPIGLWMQRILFSMGKKRA